MKVTVQKLKTVALIVFVSWNINSFAQVEKTIMYVMESDTIAFHTLASEIDNITFDEVAPDDALILQKNNGIIADTILLNEIQQIYFSGESMIVEMLSENKEYDLADIAKLLFANIGTTGINNPFVQNNLDVRAYITSVNNLVVESSVAIKLITLFGNDGKTVFQQHYKGVETRCVISLQGNASGIYLLQIETEQGIVVKKVVKPLNK